MGASPPSLLSLLGGESLLSNPIELYGIIMILAALVIVGLLARTLLKSYRENQNIGTLYFALAFILLIIAAAFLFIEQLFYTNGNITIGDIGGMIATVAVGSSMVLINLFAFHNTFPERVKILGTIVGLLTALYVGTMLWAIPQGPPIKDVINSEIVYLQVWIDILIICTVIPIVLVAPMTFHYFGLKVKSENPSNAKRSYWFAAGFYIFGLGYTGELVPFFPSDISNILRTTYLITRIILYICFTMPDWFKTRIGWTS